jgi:cellulose synthase/poly-beta-1,6-N-acetylglucosamine synthase-like glycosyltransferase
MSDIVDPRREADPWARGARSVVALLPAHDEAHGITAAVRGLQQQSVPPDRVVVVCDNCTDDTAQVARRAGAEVLETVGNTDKKAGALNQALATLLPELAANDVVLVQDADSVLAPDFLQTALTRISAGADAVGGVFLAQRPTNLLEHFQANEYARYARELSRSGRVMVLTGTAAAVRAVALRDLAGARGRVLPGNRGDVYDRHALTEDNELTLALKSRGRQLVSPLACGVSTEVMPTPADLMRQRVRWYRGAIDNLRAYGWTPVTRRYWGQQAMLALGVVAMWLYVVMTALTLVTGTFSFHPMWAWVGLAFWLERMVTVRRSTRTGRLLAALFLPELVYEAFLQVAFVRALAQSLGRAEARWYHVAVPE